jgi:hypothetical protein
MRQEAGRRNNRDEEADGKALCCDHCVETLAQNQALMTSGLHTAGLSPAFAKAYQEQIAGGNLDAARNLVDREIARTRALLDSINDFERSLDLD